MVKPDFTVPFVTTKGSRSWTATVTVRGSAAAAKPDSPPRAATMRTTKTADRTRTPVTFGPPFRYSRPRWPTRSTGN